MKINFQHSSREDRFPKRFSHGDTFARFTPEPRNSRITYEELLMVVHTGSALKDQYQLVHFGHYNFLSDQLYTTKALRDLLIENGWEPVEAELMVTQR